MKFAGLFSGIGGFELGLESVGFEPAALAEVDEACSKILAKRFPSVENLGDVRRVSKLPEVELLVAGFPCQPYSQVGTMSGLSEGGSHIREIFRLVDAAVERPRYIVLENVPNIVHLDRGAALRRVLNALESRGYTWAYRIIDAVAFGRPQRRRRWFLVASLESDAASILLAQDAEKASALTSLASGFYWTEGNRGIGWAVDAIPPLKGGSSFGIPGAPAIWNHRDRSIAVPDIRDAERLQGFRAEWTSVAGLTRLQGRERWKMVGNAVSVPVIRWLGRRILQHENMPVQGSPISKEGKLPAAAFSDGRRRYAANVGSFPVRRKMEPILSYLAYEPTPLSYRATRGFRERYERSPLKKNAEFLDALRRHERSVK